MKILFLGAYLFSSCTSSDSSNVSKETTKKSVSVKPKVVSLSRINAIPLEEISEATLKPIVQKVLERELTEQEELKLFPILQLIHSSCASVWDDKGSIAQGLVHPACTDSNDKALLQNISRQLEEQKLVKDIISSLALSGPYFKQRDQDKSIEVWLSTENPNLSDVVERIVELPVEYVYFYLYGEGPHKQLPSYFRVNLNTRNRQKMSEWLASDVKIGQFVSIVDVRSSAATSVAQNQIQAEKFGVRSSPTWFVQGYRLRGLQSIRQIERFYHYP